MSGEGRMAAAARCRPSPRRADRHACASCGSPCRATADRPAEGRRVRGRTVDPTPCAIRVDPGPAVRAAGSFSPGASWCPAPPRAPRRPRQGWCGLRRSAIAAQAPLRGVGPRRPGQKPTCVTGTKEGPQALHGLRWQRPHTATCALPWLPDGGDRVARDGLAHRGQGEDGREHGQRLENGGRPDLSLKVGAKRSTTAGVTCRSR